MKRQRVWTVPIVFRTAVTVHYDIKWDVFLLTFLCHHWLQMRVWVADRACSGNPPSSAHWGWLWRIPWSPTGCLLGQWGEPTFCRSGGLGGEEKVGKNCSMLLFCFCFVKISATVWAAPGCLYTVEMSILKVPMWVIRKARLRRWNTWEEERVH